MRELDLDELNESLYELQQNLVELQLERVSTQEKIDSFDASEYISYEEYDDFINEIHGATVDIAGSVFDPARVLRVLDRSAYNLGYNDYCANYNIEDIPEYRVLTERLNEVESEMRYIENQIEELQEGVDRASQEG
ncbi:hypothetical protein [Bacteriophage Phi NF-1]|uniref:Uncharacterized protein n=1 Tax=Bacteriophage Phi NF-1 TaxID=2900273 RepID=A0A976MG25_9CAUD|nr:hypothetical protein [Bacteriophage Phi NF-1]